MLTGNTPNPPRPRFNSCRSEPRSTSTTSWNPESNNQDLCNSTFSSINNSPVSNSSNMASSGSVNDSVLTNSNINGNSSTKNSIPCGTENGNLTRGGTNPQISPLRNSLLENGSVDSISSNTSLISVNGTSQLNISGNSMIAVGSEKPPMVPNDGRTYRDQPASSASPPTRDKLRAEDKARRRINQNQINQQQRPPTSNVENNEKLGQYTNLSNLRFNCSIINNNFRSETFMIPRSKIYNNRTCVAQTVSPIFYQTLTRGGYVIDRSVRNSLSQ